MELLLGRSPEREAASCDVAHLQNSLEMLVVLISHTLTL